MSHSTFAPSSADRWAVCQISLLPYDGPSCRSKDDYATSGTAQHKAGSRAISERKDPIEYVLDGEVFAGLPFTIAMAEAVTFYVEWARKLIDVDGYEYFIEERLEVPEIHEDCSGTTDAMLWSERNRHLIIGDYKSGWETVEPDSYQFAIYGKGGFRYLKERGIQIDRISCAVIQPLDKAEPVKWKHYTPRELDAVIAKLKRATKQNNAKAGDHCKYCPHAAVCETLDAYVAEVTDETKTDVQTLAPDRVAMILDRQQTVTNFYKSVANYGAQLIAMKINVPGWELRDSLSDRFWINEADAEKRLKQNYGGDIYEPRKMRSPAQMETVFPGAKALVKELTNRTPTGVKLKKVKTDG